MPETTQVKPWRGRKPQGWHTAIGDCLLLKERGCPASKHFKCGPDAKWACRHRIYESVIPPTKKALTDYLAVMTT